MDIIHWIIAPITSEKWGITEKQGKHWLQTAKKTKTNLYQKWLPTLYRLTTVTLSQWAKFKILISDMIHIKTHTQYGLMCDKTIHE